MWQQTIDSSLAPCVLEAGEVRLFVTIDEGDWLISLQREPGERPFQVASLDEEFPEGLSWQRIGSVEDVPILHLSPAYPDRALVVRPEMPYSVLPGERVRFFVGVSVWVRLVGKDNVTLFQFPIQTLSNTWFGAPTDGELAYAMRTRAKREGEALEFGALRVICPVRVRNQSKDVHQFERICIRPKFLSLFESESHELWANESSVIIRSDESWSQVAYARKAPKQAGRATEWVKGAEESSGLHMLRALSSGTGFFNE